MEAAIRSVQQVGPPGQRADTGPSPQPPPTMSFQQRVPPGAAQIHRSVDASQSYSRGGPSPSQSAPRSAASPLSPPRPGPGAGAANYPPFAGAPAREAPLRYGPNNSYYRDNPYTRVSQVPQVSEYHRSVPVVSVSSSIPAPISIANSMEPVQQQQPTRHRMSLLPHTPDYLQSRSAQQSSQSGQSDSGPPAFKKIRLNDTSQPTQSPLNVDTRDPPVSSGAYHPQVEAISPTLPSDPTEELRATKDDLLQQIAKVDMEIDKAEKKIAMLKKKQESLEEASLKPAVEEKAAEAQPKHRSLAQQIYAENRKRASTAHAVLSALGTATDLPLYNQPSDAETCRDIQDRHKTFRQHLLAHFKKIKSERAAKQVELTERYAQLSQDWSKRVDKMEASAKRKAKEAKNREFFEKVFPELRKQREDKERFNRVGSRIKSEADLEEIMDGLQEQAMEDKKMRSYAVIPPLMLDSRQRRLVFNNENGALIDMETEFKERLNLNVWTAGEKEVFREKFLQHPKNFGMIAASLDRKCAQDCVRYYYLSKKAENYKQLLRKSRQRTRSSRNIQKTNQNQTQCIVDALTTGVTTRLQREQQQKTVGRDRAANSTNSSIGNSSASNVTTNSSSNITNNNNGSSSSSSANSISVSNNSPQQAKHDQQQPSATTGSTTATTTSVATAAPVTSTETTSTASPPAASATVSSSSATTTTTTTSATAVESTTSSTSATSIGNSTSSNSSSTISSSNGTSTTSESSATSVVPASAESATDASAGKDETSKEKQAAGSDATITTSQPGGPGKIAPVTENCTTVPTITTTSTTATVSTAASTGTTNASLSRSATPSSAAVPAPPSITSSTSSSSSVSSSPSISSASIAPTTIPSSVTAPPLSVSSTIISSSSSSSTLATSVSSVSVTSNSSSNSTSNTNNSNISSGGSGHPLSSVTAVETSFVPNSSSSSISTIPLNGVKTDVLNSTTVTATTVAVTTPLNNSYGVNVNNVNSTMPNLTHGSVPVTLTAAAVPGGPTMPPSSQPQTHLPSIQQQQQQQQQQHLFNNSTSTPKNASSAASSMEIIIKDFTLETLVSNVVKKKFGVKDNNLLKDELEPSDPKKMRIDLDGIKDGSIIQDGKDKSGPLHACFVCKTELCPRTRPLERGRGAQYGIPEEAIPPGARVCNTCQCKSVKSRYTHCPMPTCPNPKDRVKRFRNLPPRLFELAPEIRDPIVQELQIPPNVSKCCTACLTRIRRKMGPHLFGTNLTDDEVARMKKLLQDIGPKWNQLAEALNKTPVALKSFYFHYKKKCGFDAAVTEYYKQHPGEDRRPAMTDGDESDLSASSSDERDGSSDTTASAESPNNSVPLNVTKDEINTVPETLAPPPLTKSFEDDLRLLPPGQPPRKPKLTEEYDSSATETADEENETSPANRQSPKVHYPPMNPVISVHHPLQNGPRLGEAGSPQNVRDAIQHVIERSLKSNNMMSSSVKPPSMKSMNDSPFVRDYRDLSKGPPPPSSIQRSEGMATLSVVNSHAPHGQLISHHPHSIGSQIQATITPVPHQQQQQQQQQSGPPPTSQPQSIQQQPPPSSQPVSSSEKDVPVVFLRDAEPQTLDLSIKKPQRDNFPPPAHNSNKPPPSVASQQGTLTLYTRSEFPPPSQQQQQNIPTHGPPYGLSFLGDSMGRPSKSPSGYITTIPGGPPGMTLNQGGPPNQPPTSIIGGRGPMQQQQQHTISLTPPPVKKSNAPKLSPKMPPQHQQQVQSGMQQHQPQSAHGGGPKGSITHGTPVNAAGQQIIIQGQTTLSPRYDNMLRQTPPSSNDKHGSITQGTPVHLSSHALPDKRSAYEYKSSYNNRQSPAQVSQPPPQGSPQAPPPQFAYSRSGPTFTLEPPPPQFSSQQIIMNDYITSQQMQGRNAGSASGSGGRPEKESPSPRSVPTSSPASLLFSVPDRSDRSSRPEYLSRASPADHVNRVSPVFSTPSPHRTPPPPQRQGVIQRHNTGSGATGGVGSSNSGPGSKPPSPAPNRLHLVPPPSHHYMSGHDAFTSLVDLAVQQQPLTVPHKDEKRPSIAEQQQQQQQQPPPPPPTHHDIRYHPAAMIQIHHQQQQAVAAAAAAAAAQQQQQHQQHQQHVAAVAAAQQQHHAAAAAAAVAQQQQQQIQRQQQMDLQRRQAQLHPSIQQQHQSAALAYREQQMERDRELNYRIERDRQQAEAENEDRRRRQQQRERIAHQEEEDRRRKHYDMINERMERPMETIGIRSSSDGSLTAANLIDAIITHQINQTASEPPFPPSRDMQRPSFFPTRDHRPSPISENNGKSHSPNVINIDVDSEPPVPRTKNITIGELAESIIAKDYSPNSMPFLQLRQSMMGGPPGSGGPPGGLDPAAMVAPDAWKYRRMAPSGKDDHPPPPSQSAAQQKQQQQQQQHQQQQQQIHHQLQMQQAAQQQQQQQHQQQQGPPGHQYMHPSQQQQQQQQAQHQAQQQQMQNKAMGRSAQPDDRHIIRMAQSPRPRNKFHEPVSQQDAQFFHPGAPLSRAPRDFALDCYVKNRIVEAMRTEDDKRGDEGRDHHQQQQQSSSRNPSPAQQQQQHGPPPPAHHNKDHDRSSTPGDMMIDEETGRPASGGNHHRPPSSSQQQQQSLPPHSQSQGIVHNSLHSSPYMGSQSVPVTTFPSQSFYPYSALTVSGGPVTVGNLGPPPGHGPKVSSMGGMQNLGGGGPGGGGGGMNDDRQQSSSSSAAMEPKPLLSAQYEALSDED